MKKNDTKWAEINNLPKDKELGKQLFDQKNDVNIGTRANRPEILTCEKLFAFLISYRA